CVLAPLLARGGDRDATRLAAEGRLLGGDAAARVGSRESARERREAALALVPPGGGQAIEKRALAVTARALLSLDRMDEARPLVERLFALGYRHPTLTATWQQKAR